MAVAMLAQVTSRTLRLKIKAPLGLPSIAVLFATIAVAVATASNYTIDFALYVYTSYTRPIM